MTSRLTYADGVSGRRAAVRGTPIRGDPRVTMESDEDQLQEDGADSDEKSDASGAQGEDTPPGEDASPEEGEEPRRRPTLEVIGAMRDVITPCLLLDYDKVTRNIDAMAAQARKLGVQLRPHMKSHKCM